MPAGRTPFNKPNALYLDELNNPDLHESYRLEMEKISLIRRYAEFLNFGTQFDHGGEEAAVNYFERLEQTRSLIPDGTEARNSRRMLYNALVQAGMEPYADEWWHFNSPRSQMGAQTAGRERAEYGGMDLSAENAKFEQMRQMHRAGLIKIQEGLLQNFHFSGKVDPLDDLIRLNEEVLNETGNSRLTGLPRAAVIALPELEAA